MSLEFVKLEINHLKKLIVLPSTGPVTPKTLEESYFSKGSIAYCLLDGTEPVFACGIVNLQWGRGEVWIIPNEFFRNHQKTCLRIFRKMLPQVAKDHKFRRVQAVCAVDQPETLFRHMGFECEGTLKSFGPFGESCRMYAKVFE